jgi:hypothetical protein
MITQDWLSTDKFNYNDWNLIKQEYDDLILICNKFYTLPIDELEEFTDYNQYPTELTYNQIEDRLNKIKQKIELYPETFRSWIGNGFSPTYLDINRWSQFINVYLKKFQDSEKGINKLGFRLGNGGQIKC